MKNVIVYLIGFPGVGKLTVAKELAQKINARIIDNHLINNPILQFINTQSSTPISEKVWEKIATIREIVLSGIEELADSQINLIFTNALMADDPEDLQIFERVVEVARKRKSTLVVIRLMCDINELSKRVVSEDRVKKFKLTNARILQERFKTDEVYQPEGINTVTLDVTTLEPNQAADAIYNILQKYAPNN